MKKINLKGTNTIFHKKDNVFGRSVQNINLKYFNPLYYFDGFFLKKIKSFEYEIKSTKIWFTFQTDKGPEVLKISYKKSENTTILKIWYDDKIPALYNSLEDFVEDTKIYFNEQQKLKNKYFENYKRKENEINSSTNQLKEIMDKFPEYFI